ncbi:flagellar filament capping protein FliD [Orenia marismortui]|uniref:Flagellar hook-associated protein 2 n=1 Tax=Orenia marismortui TaxID=46469 RepID=A0A4R8HFV6_9FIRM|nr:flagellar filament capping protein FliD [Orenia marismortui]TDX58902.1 flagellar hook-associated protein [Orenia marismortui]
MGISLGGFSGLDTDSIIQQLMYVERAPIRRMESKQSEINNEISAWQNMNTSLDTLKKQVEEFKVGTDNIFDHMTATSSDEDILQVSASDSARAGSHDLTVNQLAKNHRVASAQQSDSTSSLTLTTGAFTISLANGGEYDDKVNISTASETEIKSLLKSKAGLDDATAQTTAATIVSNQGSYTNLDSVQTINGLSDQVFEDIKGEIMTNDQKLKLDISIDGTESLNDVMDKINNAVGNDDGTGENMINASVVDNTLVIESAVSGTNNELQFNDTDGVLKELGVLGVTASNQFNDSTSGLGHANGTFNLTSSNGASIDITMGSNYSLEDVKEAINNNGSNDGSIKASIQDNKLVIDDLSGGTLSFGDTTGSVLSDLGVSTGNQRNLQSAQDAKFTLDSLSITRSSNEIDDVLEGVSLELSGLNESGETTTFTIDTAKEDITTTIKSFVDQYNSVIGKLEKYGGKEAILQGDSTLNSVRSMLYNSTVLPSTTISSTEWLSNTPFDENGTSGTLAVEAEQADGTTADYNIGITDTDTLDDILQKFQSAGLTDDGTGVYSDANIEVYVSEDNQLTIESKNGKSVDLSNSSSQVLSDLKMPQSFEKNTISLLGIEVDSDGRLSVDSNKLKDALDNNLSDVKQMFTGVNGIMDRVSDQVDLATDNFDGYLSNRIDSLESEVDYLDEDIESLERRLTIREEGLQAQFTAMEQAIAQMQNQGSWLSSQTTSTGF